MRRFGEPKNPDQTYTPRPGAYGLLVRDNDVLLTHQALPNPEVQLPGGGIDPGESPVQALHREVIEETGWRIRVARRIGVYQRYTYMTEYDLWARKICHVYLARPTRQICEPLEPEHSAFWASWQDVPSLLDSAGDATIAGQFLKTGRF